MATEYQAREEKDERLIEEAKAKLEQEKAAEPTVGKVKSEVLPDGHTLTYSIRKDGSLLANKSHNLPQHLRETE